MLTLKIADTVAVSKTVGESDVYLFAQITGDFSPNHVNEEFMRKHFLRAENCPWALVVALMSSASSVPALAKPQFLLVIQTHGCAMGFGDAGPGPPPTIPTSTLLCSCDPIISNETMNSNAPR